MGKEKTIVKKNQVVYHHYLQQNVFIKNQVSLLQVMNVKHSKQNLKLNLIVIGIYKWAKEKILEEQEQIDKKLEIIKKLLMPWSKIDQKIEN